MIWFILGVLATLVVGYFTVRSFNKKTNALYAGALAEYAKLRTDYEAIVTELTTLKSKL